MPPECLISDSNIWIDLHRGSLLQEVFRLPYRLVTTDFVFEELEYPRGSDLCRLGLSVLNFSGEETLKLYELRKILRNSSLADVSCFHLASQRGWILLTGDRAVRLACQKRGLEVHGTLWLLDALYRYRIVTGKALSRALEEMRRKGGRFPQKACEECLSQWQA